MRRISLHHAGIDLQGELYAPDRAQGLPGVMVMHTGLGLGAQVREVSGKLVALGYAALVTDMFGDDFGGDPAKAGPIFEALTQDRGLLRERVVAWFDLCAQLSEVDANRIAAIGYCFGGLCVLELARSGADIKAVVSFHGLLSTHAPAQPGTIKGEVAAWCGGKDPYAPNGDIEVFRTEMNAAGAHLHLTVFEQAEHGFTDRDAAILGRPGISYDVVADAASWAGTLALLSKNLNQEKGLHG